jgi:hypothetical protein
MFMRGDSGRPPPDTTHEQFAIFHLPSAAKRKIENGKWQMNFCS